MIEKEGSTTPLFLKMLSSSSSLIAVKCAVKCTVEGIEVVVAAV